LSRYDGRFAARADLALLVETDGVSRLAEEEGAFEERAEGPRLEGVNGVVET